MGRGLKWATGAGARNTIRGSSDPDGEEHAQSVKLSVCQSFSAWRYADSCSSQKLCKYIRLHKGLPSVVKGALEFVPQLINQRSRQLKAQSFRAYASGEGCSGFSYHRPSKGHLAWSKPLRSGDCGGSRSGCKGSQEES